MDKMMGSMGATRTCGCRCWASLLPPCAAGCWCRFSAAYFLCPSYDSPVGTCGEPSPYRTFTFGEYRRKVQEDVKRTGRKIGLPNFLKQQPPRPQ